MYDIIEEQFLVFRSDKEDKLHQRGKVFWLTGLSGSGKSTIAKNLEKNLFIKGFNCITLDGDLLRKGLNSDLGFSKDDRYENIRRIAEISKILVNQGLIVIVSTISPYESLRNLAKTTIGEKDFSLIHIVTSLDTCVKRDVKGLYKRAKDGSLLNFTAISDNFDTPNDNTFSISGEEGKLLSSISKLEDLVIRLCKKGM